jgi:hypothetical protein
VDWFEKLTGFRETSYEETRARLEVEGGMLVVETIAKIRRAHFIQGKTIKAICRELRVMISPR